VRSEPIAIAAVCAAAIGLTGAAGGGVSSIGVGPGAWSPDGKQILFGRHVNGSSQLVVMNAAGSDLKVIWTRTRGESGWDAVQPDKVSFSPDGRRFGLIGDFLLVVTNRNGDTLHQWLGYWDYAWAPGGRSVAAYTAEFGGNLVILALDHPPRRITRGHDVEPAWSPTAQTIAFARDRATSGGMPEPGPYDLYAIRANGSGLKRLARDAEHPLWSPNGDRIAFWRSSGYEIWSLRRNGSLGRLLRRMPDSTIEPARWTRSGKRLLVLRRGSPSERVLSSRYAQSAAFSPNGTRILFYASSRRCKDGAIWLLEVSSHKLKRLAGECQ
jgi:WD40 repeat protein